MSSTEADSIDKLYKNYDILSDAKDKISEVSFTSIFLLLWPVVPSNIRTQSKTSIVCHIQCPVNNSFGFSLCCPHKLCPHSMKRSIAKYWPLSKGPRRRSAWLHSLSANFSNTFRAFPMMPSTRPWICARTTTFRFAAKQSRTCR